MERWPEGTGSILIRHNPKNSLLRASDSSEEFDHLTWACVSEGLEAHNREQPAKTHSAQPGGPYALGHRLHLRATHHCDFSAFGHGRVAFGNRGVCAHFQPRTNDRAKTNRPLLGIRFLTSPFRKSEVSTVKVPRHCTTVASSSVEICRFRPEVEIIAGSGIKFHSGKGVAFHDRHDPNYCFITKTALAGFRRS